MRTLTEVEEAKALMREAAEWSVVRWLREKKRVRRTADVANGALDRLQAEMRARWPEDLRAGYEALAQRGSRKHTRPDGLASEIYRLDDAAHRARMDAEGTFDEAERQLSARIAREGCGKAIFSWELYEKAIAAAERAVTAAKPSR